MHGGSMSFKSCLMSGTLALIAGCLAGYWVSSLQWETRESRINEIQAREETLRLEKAMEENRNLHETVNQMQIRAKKENDDAKRENDLLLARIKRADVRVSIPAVRVVKTYPVVDIPALMMEKSRAELDPTVVERILSVGRDGDTAIRNMNQCIDQYQALAKLCSHS